MGEQDGTSPSKRLLAVAGIGSLALLITLVTSLRSDRPTEPRSERSGGGNGSGSVSEQTQVLRMPRAPVRGSAGSRGDARVRMTPTAAYTSGEGNEDPATTEPEDPRHPYVSEDLIGMDDSYEPDVAFGEAEKEFGVPADLMKAIAFVETQGNHRFGMRREDGSFGVMRLREGNGASTLDEAANLLGVEKKVLVRDPVQNIRGAAAVLREYHKEAERDPDGPNPWLVAVTLYSGRTAEAGVAYAREIENILQEGLSHSLDSGQLLYINPNQSHLISPAKDDKDTKP